MDVKRFMVGTLVAAVLLGTGYVLFALALPGFVTYALNAGSATGVERDQPLMWAVALGELSYSALITLAIGVRAGVSTATAGARLNAGSLTSTIVPHPLSLPRPE